jgi:hypothetical protein
MLYVIECGILELVLSSSCLRHLYYAQIEEGDH